MQQVLSSFRIIINTDIGEDFLPIIPNWKLSREFREPHKAMPIMKEINKNVGGRHGLADMWITWTLEENMG